MSPFIVTTKRPATIADGLGFRYDESSRTVATLDEAREEAWLVVRSTYGARRMDDTGQELRRACQDLPESGGTVTLPDGTVIEVQRVTTDDLMATLPWQQRLTLEGDAVIIAAFNAQEAQR